MLALAFPQAIHLICQEQNSGTLAERKGVLAAKIVLVLLVHYGMEQMTR